MKRNHWKMLKILMVTFLFCFLFSSTALAEIDYPKNMTIYKNSKSAGAYVYGYINLTDLQPSDQITKGSLKSSSTILQNLSATRYIFLDRYEDIYPGTWDDIEYRWDSAAIEFTAHRTGIARVNFKIGNKSYSTKVKVLAYENPLSKVTITGIKNGTNTNLASMLKNRNIAEIRNTKTINNAKLSITAAKNWKITGLHYNSSNGETRSLNCYRSSVSMNVGKLAKNKVSYISCWMENVTTGGTIYCYYYLND